MHKLTILTKKVLLSKTTARTITLLPMILSFASEALADVDLMAGGKGFFDPLIEFAKVYAPIIVFLFGLVGGIAAPGSGTTKVAVGAGIMGGGGLLIKAGQKAFNVT